MLLSEYIRRARERHGWSQESFAERLGVSVSTVRRWESGDYEPVAYHLLKIEALIGLPSDQYERTWRMHQDYEQAGTYFVLPSQDEMERLDIQAQMVTDQQGGLVPEQPDLSYVCSVLDVGCGTGHWLRELAKEHAHIERLVGVDFNPKMVKYARAHAEAAHVADRVEFAVMDALQVIEIPGVSFDLVNLRFGVSWIRTWEWPGILKRMRNCLRPGGIIRLVEQQYLQSALTWLNLFWDLGRQAAGNAGYLTSDIVSTHLPRYLSEAQFAATTMHRRVVDVVNRQGMPDYPLFAENVRRLARSSEPFLRKWVNLDERLRERGLTTYQQLVERINADLALPEAEAVHPIETFWATR